MIFNDDPQCCIKNFKPLPVLDFRFDNIPDGGQFLTLAEGTRSSTKDMVEGVRRANKCIECGFCEVNCVSCGFTISSRMRIVVQREIRDLENRGADPERVARLRKLYEYYGDATCAADGLCATSCPMKINTGERNLWRYAPRRPSALDFGYAPQHTTAKTRYSRGSRRPQGCLFPQLYQSDDGRRKGIASQKHSR